jgi:hypothetical protein
MFSCSYEVTRIIAALFHQRRDSSYSVICVQRYEDATQGVATEIRKVLAFFANFYCPKAFHRPDNSIPVVEYHRNKFVFKPNILNGAGTPNGFTVLSSP